MVMGCHWYFEMNRRMWRWLILIYCVLFHTGCAAAQQVLIGARLGGNASRLKGLEGGTTMAGYNIGLFLMYKSAQPWLISSDVLFSSQGANFKLQSDTTYDGYINMNYVSLPILFHVRLLPEEGTCNVRIFAGPSISFLLGASKGSRTINGEGTYYTSIQNVKNAYHSFDLSTILGIGFTYRMDSNVHFFTDLQYNV